MSSISRSSKTRFTQGRLFYTQGPLFGALGPLFCALVREEAISLPVNCAQTRVLHACVKQKYLLNNWISFLDFPIDKDCIENY